MDKPEVEHITMSCPRAGCDIKAFVQVVVVPEKELQSKITARAILKLKKTLREQHKEGLHV